MTEHRSGMDSVAEFYGANPITIFVASDAEGAYGVYAKTLARHLPKHIPNNPEIAVVFRPGAGGLLATNEIATTAPRDGTAIGAIRGATAVEPVLDPDGAKFDSRELSWIGNVSRQSGTIITWHSSDIKTIEDARRRDVVVGADSPQSNIGTLPNILNAVLGTRFQTVHGYSGLALKRALETGKVEGICGMGYNTLIAAYPEWVENDLINILAHTGLEPDPMIPEIPRTTDYATSEDDRMVIRMMDYRQVLGRPYVAPPGVPADRLEALRLGFQKTMTDKAFLADAKANNMIIDPLDHKAMEKIISDAYAMDPGVARHTWELLNGINL
jgi:hypothetical protein